MAVLVLAGIMVGVLLLLGGGAAYWWVVTERVRLMKEVAAARDLAEYQRAVAVAQQAQAAAAAAEEEEEAGRAIDEGSGDGDARNGGAYRGGRKGSAE